MRHTITTEEEFIALMQSGVTVWGGEGANYECDVSCVTALQNPKEYPKWRHDFLTKWLPSGNYQVEVE